MAEKGNALENELKWVQIRDESSSYKKPDRGIADFLIPIGALSTIGVLGYGLYNFYMGDHKKQQQLMRIRILSQGVTLVIACVGIALAGDRTVCLLRSKKQSQV